MNGEEVGAVVDDLYSTGSVGFTTYKGQDIRFDNIRVRSLETHTEDPE